MREATEKRRTGLSLPRGDISIDRCRETERERKKEGGGSGAAEWSVDRISSRWRRDPVIHGPNIGTPYLLLESTSAHRMNPVGESRE